MPKPVLNSERFLLYHGIFWNGRKPSGQFSDRFLAFPERKGALTVCIQGMKGAFRFSAKEDNKTIGRMLVSQPITFPKRHITNTKCGVISPNSAYRKRQPLYIKQLPLRGYEVLEHISVRAVKVIVSLTDACFSAVDPASADTKFCADFGLHHTVHIAVQDSQFQSRKL